MTQEDPWLDVRVVRHWREAADVVGLELRSATGHELPAFEAGSCTDVLTPSGQIRPYSICSSPRDRSRYIIAVLREGKGRGGSVAMHDLVSTGDLLKIRAPRNAFPLAGHAVQSLLIAGGIGIAPLVAMAEDLNARGAPFRMFYCARNRERAAFATYLAGRPYSSNVRFHWSEQLGRPDFIKLLKPVPSCCEIYSCGPTAFIDRIARAVRERFGSGKLLRFESFFLEPSSSVTD